MYKTIILAAAIIITSPVTAGHVGSDFDHCRNADGQFERCSFWSSSSHSHKKTRANNSRSNRSNNDSALGYIIKGVSWIFD